MRIKRPDNGAPPVNGVDAPNEVSEVGGTAPPNSATQAAPVGKAAPAGASQAADPVARVASQLRAGEITVDQAVDQLIDDAVGKQLGAIGKDFEPKLRELLRSYAEADPFLAARIRRLTLAK